MSDQIELGFRPQPLRLYLNAASDFVCTLRNRSGDWPVGTSLSLAVGTLTWTATITGTDAAFSVDKSVVASVENGAPVSLLYANAGSDVVLATGQVVRTDG